jgi:hypothetical protein
VTLLTYPAAAASFTLYDDDGRDERVPPRRVCADGFRVRQRASALECRIGASARSSECVHRTHVHFQIRAALRRGERAQGMRGICLTVATPGAGVVA